jgi:hypothetical protein
MRSWNRHLRLVCVATLSVALGCSHLAQVPVEYELGRHGDSEQPWVRIDGFTGRDGVSVEVSGYATVVGDSFLVYSAKPETVKETARLLVALPRSEVRLLHVREKDPGKTYQLVGGVVLVALGVLLIVLISEISSANGKPL